MISELERELIVHSRHQEDSFVMEVSGELHLPTAPRFRELLQEIVSTQEGAVLLDFRQVGFMDSSGMKALMDARKQLALQGRSFRLLLTAGTQPDRVMQTSRLNTVIPLIYG